MLPLLNRNPAPRFLIPGKYNKQRFNIDSSTVPSFGLDVNKFLKNGTAWDTSSGGRVGNNNLRNPKTVGFAATAASFTAGNSVLNAGTAAGGGAADAILPYFPKLK